LKRLQSLVISLLIVLITFGVPRFAAATNILLNEVEVNPPGTDSGFEKVELYNPSAGPIDVSGWTISSTAGRTATFTINDGIVIPANGYLVIGKDTQWLDNSGEVVELNDNSGILVDSAGPFNDDDNDKASWQRSPNASDNWIFAISTLGKANVGTSNTPSPSQQEPAPAPGSEPTPSPIEEPPDETPPSSPPLGSSDLKVGASNNGLKIIVIDVGQGSSELVVLPNGKTLLIDGGERDQGQSVIETLRENGVSKIDVIVATHPHADHIGGLIDVINTMEVGEVLDSGQIHTTQTFEDFLDAIDAKQIPLDSIHDGDSIELDTSVKLQVLNPPATLPDGADDEEQFNNNSVVIKLTFGDFTAMLPGDMQAENEIRLSDRNIDSDVLVAGHHGSRTSSTSQFLNAVSPDVVIISVGEDNSYGHPHQEALDRISTAGTLHLFRTDQDGTIIITTTGNDEYTVETTESHKTVLVPEFGGAILIATIALISVIAVINRDRIWKGSSRLV
jgi:competence protein ComEC